MSRRNKFPVLFATIFICSCSSSGPVITDTLDPVTGITLTHTAVPLVFYRDRSARAAYARDFVGVGPIQTNRMGLYRYYIWLTVWSTIGNEQLSDELLGFDSIILFVDGEPLELSSIGVTPSTIGASESVYVKPLASSGELYYEVTVDQLRLIAGSMDIRLQSTGRDAEAYVPWDNQGLARASMQAFLEYVSY